MQWHKIRFTWHCFKKEDKIDKVSEALGKLRELGIGDDDISVISGVPYSEKIWAAPCVGRASRKLAWPGAVVGFIVAVLLNWGTPALYSLRVGGQPLFPIPTSIVLF